MLPFISKYWYSKKKKKKNRYLIWTITGVLVSVAMVGIYFFLAKRNSSQIATENEEGGQNYEKKDQQLRQQLNRIEEKLNEPENLSEKVKFFRKLILLKEELNNFSQFSNQGKKEVIRRLDDFIKNVEEELKSKDEPISSTFELKQDDKIGYWLFESDKEGQIKVYIAKNHPFLKGKRLDSSKNTLSFSIRFKKKNASHQEGNKVWYFEKNNSNFELKLLGDWPDDATQKKELEVSYIGKKEKSPIHFGSDNFVFSYSSKEEEKYVHINEKHPRIKELLNEGKLKKDNKFTIRYLEDDYKTRKAFFFKEDNENLEIIKV